MSSSSSTIDPGSVLENKWEIIKLIGKGKILAFLKFSGIEILF
jgi:hypothetical protein